LGFAPIQHRFYRHTPWYDFPLRACLRLGNYASSAVLWKKWMNGRSAAATLEGEYFNVT
jgi:hypothetical protein